MHITALARGVAASALAAGILSATATTASAAAYVSPSWMTMGECQAAQRAWQSSWTSVTRSCYAFVPTAGGISLDHYRYRFEGVTR